MSGPVVIDLPYPPSLNAKYGKRADGGVYLKRSVRDWRNLAGWEIHRQKPDRIEGPYRFKMLVARPDNRTRDIDNLIKEPLDLLVSLGVVPDDSLVSKASAEWSDHIGVGCRVILTPVEA